MTGGDVEDCERHITLAGIDLRRSGPQPSHQYPLGVTNISPSRGAAPMGHVHTGQLLSYLRSMGAPRPEIWD